MKLRLLLLVILKSTLNFTQNTVGTTDVNQDVSEGYTLFTISTKTFLIDNCGRQINSWTSTFPPGNAVYLLEDGSILRAGRTSSSSGVVLGGIGGVIEKYDWEGNLTWQYFYDTPTERQHHDIYPMPNGNVLILAATIMTEAEAIQAGRNPSELPSTSLYNEQIVEVTPDGIDDATIVWEWNIKDHLIQDFDITKDNYGIVEDNPNKLDINYFSTGSNSANWLHINSIQYDETLDQIILSSRNLSEIYIIDHSTSTTEAATGSGGNYGKGGDLLYRWGNPEAYKRGTSADRKLFGQHFPHIIRNNSTDNGKIIVFNNGNGRTPSFSEVFVLNLPTSAPGVYFLNTSQTYGPSAPDYTYTSPVQGDFYSSILSGAQRLSNGNTIIMEGTKGRIFEIDASDNIVWEYFIPVNATDGTFISQGTDPNSYPNNCFRATKYSTTYAAFNGRTITPSLPIETNPNTTSCERTLDNNNLSIPSVKIFPNPLVNIINIQSNIEIDSIEIFNINGIKVASVKGENSLDISFLNGGIYFLRASSQGQFFSRKIIKN